MNGMRCANEKAFFAASEAQTVATNALQLIVDKKIGASSAFRFEAFVEVRRALFLSPCLVEPDFERGH